MDIRWEKDIRAVYSAVKAAPVRCQVGSVCAHVNAVTLIVKDPRTKRTAVCVF